MFVKRVMASLAAVALGATGLLVGAGKAPAAPEETQQTWANVGLTCRNLAAGRVCVALQRLGSTNSYRGMYYVVPAAGQWIKPAAHAVWLAQPQGGLNANLAHINTKYEPLCAGGCPSYTKPAVHYKYFNTPNMHTLLFDTPQGRFDVHAGYTPLQSVAINNCTPGPPVYANMTLRSTNDNKVWYQRSVGFSGVTKPRRLTATDSGNYRFFTKSFSGTVGKSYRYQSPTYTTAWQRTRQADGTWDVQRTVAALTYIGWAGETYTENSDTFAEYVC